MFASQLSIRAETVTGYSFFTNVVYICCVCTRDVKFVYFLNSTFVCKNSNFVYVPDRQTRVTHAGRSSDRVRWRACDLPYLASGWRLRHPVTFPACVLTRASQRRRPSCCPPFHAPNPPATLTDCPVASDGVVGVVIPCLSGT